MKWEMNRSDGVFHYVLGELSYDDFDKSERIGLSKLFKLAEGARFVYFKYGPDSTWRDFDRTSVFIRSQSCQVYPALYTSNLTRNHSLKISSFISYLGKSSYCMDHDIIDSITSEPLASFSVHAVLVSKETRRPTPLPSEALQILKVKPSKEKRPVPDPRVPAQPADCFSQKRIVMPSDTDFNQHLNQASFIQFCVDCASMAALQGKLPSFKTDVIFSDVKAVWISYAQEARVGEEVTLSCWEDEDSKGTIWIKIGRESQVKGQCQLQFMRIGQKPLLLQEKKEMTVAKL